MTLQERMIATYLRQANLPPEEKMKLKLFLGLLLVTFDTDPSDEDAQHSTAQHSAPPPPETPATAFSQASPTLPAGDVNTSSAKAPGGEGEAKMPDPLAEGLLAALDRRGLSLEEAAGTAHISVRPSVLQQLLDGKPIRKDSREKISRWVQDVGIAIAENTSSEAGPASTSL